MYFHSSVAFLTLLGCFPASHSRPSGTSTTERPLIEPFAGDPDIILSRLEVVSNIQFRYASTKLSAYYKNPSVSGSQQAKFKIKLPENAFISNLSMILNSGEEFVAQIKEKEAARNDYEEAISSGSTAGLVSASIVNREFVVESSVESSEKVEFVVSYEELLPRSRSAYEHAVHLNTQKYIIPDFTITVNINESLPLTHLSVPVILDQSNLIDDAKGASFLAQNEEAVIERDLEGDPSKARVTLRISEEYQRNTPLDSAKFVVRYDVDRKEENEIQVIDGYFVHFLVPKETGKILPKHVVFVLDVSGSMQGEKIEQMKDAMITIIDELGPQDRFNILAFSDDVFNWIPSSNAKENYELSLSYPATDFYKNQALEYILTLGPLGGTNINEGMLEGLHTIRNVSLNEEVAFGTAKMLIFLTDGQATTGVRDSKSIVSNVVKANDDALIYGLAFGSGADFDLIKTISSSNGGFARRIHSGADAALQLENFFSEISSPLFSNLQVKYVGGVAQNVTDPILKTFFKDQEMIVVGKIRDTESQALSFSVSRKNSQDELNERFIVCLRNDDDQFRIRPYPPLPNPCPPIPPIPSLPPKSPSQNFIERLWAYKTIKNLMIAYNNELKSETPNATEIQLNKKKILDLSLKYNFVSPLTSLVATPNSPPRLDELPSFQINQGFGAPLFFSAPKGRIRGSVGSRNSLLGSLHTTTTRRPFTSTSNRPQDYDFDIQYELEDAQDLHLNSSVDVSSCTGNITLFTKTYLRGSNITLSSDEELNLGAFKVVSLRVEGNCCWRIFSQAGFQGESSLFSFRGGKTSSGVYNSASEMGNVFRKASSLRKAPCHS